MPLYLQQSVNWILGRSPKIGQLCPFYFAAVYKTKLLKIPRALLMSFHRGVKLYLNMKICGDLQMPWETHRRLKLECCRILSNCAEMPAQMSWF